MVGNVKLSMPDLVKLKAAERRGKAKAVGEGRRAAEPLETAAIQKLMHRYVVVLLEAATFHAATDCWENKARNL